MSSCQHANDLIAYMLDLLENGQKKKFEAHLKQCPVCQRELQVESVIKKEFAQRLEPGQIEQRVLANLSLRRSLKPGFSWLYMVRMGIYALAMMTGAFFIIPWLLEYPMSKLFNLNISFNLLEELSAISGFINYPYLFGVIIFILLGACSIYSYKLLRE